jgi:hexosaminidase
MFLNRVNCVLLFALILFFTSLSDLFSQKPLTIPAIREWNDRSGKFVLTSNSRIIIDKNYYQELIETAKTFAEDLLALKNFKPEIIKGDKAGSSDFFLTLGMKDSILGKEGYEMAVGDSISIIANTSTGVFYGTRSLLQILKHSDKISGGFARDYPDYPERAFMVDNGRKYFSVEWMENQIKELSYIKMNYFHWHISDNQGFRIESVSHPEIVSNQHYSRQEVLYLLEIARKYHVLIVPEIDMPGHMGAILKNNDKYALRDFNSNIYDSYLDFTEDSARQFAREIILEYIDLFPGQFWHGGVDEYVYNNFERFPQFQDYAKKLYGNEAIGSDAVIGFINWMNSLVREKGKTLRIWNDPISKLKNNGGKGTADKNIIIEYWCGDDEPNDFINSDYNISNCSIDFLYYNLGGSWLGYNEFLYERWKPSIFQGGKRVPEKHPQNNGSKYHVWCDNPDNETEGHVAVAIRFVMKVLSQGLWGSPMLVPKVDQFEKLADSIGLAPGVVYPENPMPGNLAFKKYVRSESVRQNSVNIPQRINDGNRNTQWVSDYRDTSWIYVDLADTFKINQIKLIWFHTPAKQFKVQVSNDSLNWQTIRSFTDSIQWIMDLKELDAVGRYIRIFLTQHVDSSFYTLWEIEAYGTKYIKTDTSNDTIIDNIRIYPTPFSSFVTIEYFLNTDTDVKVKVFDIQGNEVGCLFDGSMQKGKNYLNWNGEGCSQGEYIFKIEAGKNTYSIKTILIK